MEKHIYESMWRETPHEQKEAVKKWFSSYEMSDEKVNRYLGGARYYEKSS